MIEILERQQLIKMVLHNIIFTEVSRISRNTKVRIRAVISELIEFFKHYVVILFDHQLTLMQQSSRFGVYNLGYVEFEELKDML